MESEATDGVAGPEEDHGQSTSDHSLQGVATRSVSEVFGGEAAVEFRLELTA